MLGARRVKTPRMRGLTLASSEESTVGYPVFEKMVGKMGKTGLMKGGDAGMAQQLVTQRRLRKRN